MIDTLTRLYSDILVAMKDNQILAAAVSLWGLSVATFFLRDIPTRFFWFLYRQSTTLFEVNNFGAEANLNVYNRFVSDISTRRGFNLSRALSLRTASWSRGHSGAAEDIQPGVGLHFFFSGWRLFWYLRERVDSSATEHQKETIRITTLGRSHRPFYRLYDEIMPKPAVKNIGVHYFEGRYWDKVFDLNKRPFATVITKDGIKDKILSNMRRFLTSEDWYTEKGINWKETFVLHGPPGTGKTGLVRALASELECDIYNVDLSLMSNGSFGRALSSIPPGNICLIEDFDSAQATHRRAGVQSGTESKTEVKVEKDISSPANYLSSLLDGLFTLSGMLNTLDGISSLHGVIVVMTTNCIDSIDTALLRAGRCDYIYYLGWLGDKEIREYANVVFPGIEIPEGITFKDMPGCELYDRFKEHRDDPVKFLEAVHAFEPREH